MSAERLKILEMLQQGKITAGQANALLEALEPTRAEAPREQVPPPPEAPSPPPPPGPEPFRLPIPLMDWAQVGRQIAEQVKSQLASAFGAMGGGMGKTRSNFSRARLTRNYLAGMENASTYANYGTLFIAEDVPQELLSAKIARFHNYGRVVGPAALLKVLEARTEANFGAFEEAKGAEPASPREPAAERGPRESEVMLAEEEVGDWCPQLEVTAEAGRLEFGAAEGSTLRVFVSPAGARASEGWPEASGAVCCTAERHDRRLVVTLGGPEAVVAAGLVYRFEVPARLSVKASLGRGDISAQGLAGSLELHTSAGRIACRDIAGSITAGTGAGGLDLADIAGSVTVRAAEGDARVQDVAGSVTVHVERGSVAVNDVAGSVTAEAGGEVKVSDVSGDAVARARGGGSVALVDVGGSVTAETEGAPIRVSDVGGGVTARSQGGDIAISDVGAGVTVRAAGGKVSLNDIGGAVTSENDEG